ncbi:MAG TPA: hypothetical protein VGM82_06140 [Gemmatimonadaceae bacterium]|jgi:hypothetical protein
MPAIIGASFATPASAQLGGLMKKAKEAAAQKTGEKAVDKAMPNRNLKASDAFGPELTSESLDGVLRGLATLGKKKGDADALRAQGQEYQVALSKSMDAHDRERQAFDAKYERARNCQDSVIDVRSRAAQEAYMTRMQSDPAAQAAMIKTAQELALKNATGKDTAAMRDAYIKMAKAQGIDPKADTLAAAKQCGAIPAKAVWFTEQDSLRARSARAESEVREMESKADGEAATASGMDRRAFALARERVLHWYRETHGGSPIQAFGNDERKLLESRTTDIEKFNTLLS